jgi:DNA-binding NarL/FixJ family response regulator
MKIKVLLVEDHSIVREGLQVLFADEPELRIIGEASNGAEALEFVRTNKPDLVLMDINMPVMNGIECTRELKKLYPEIKIVVLSMHDQESYLVDILNSGAEGFVIKNTKKAELVFAIKKVMSGGTYIGPEFTINMLARVNSGERLVINKNSTIKLSTGEKQVLDLILSGMTNAQMAQKLFTSVRTIETRRKKLLEKTGTINTATLVKYALLNGL